MRLLLDTHVLLWALTDAPQLPERFATAIMDADNRVLVSAASLWEIAIKQGLGRLELADDVDVVEAITVSGFEELPVTGRHAAATARLPQLHRDPFDRMLIAQAIHEGVELLTVDARLHDYPEVRLLTP